KLDEEILILEEKDKFLSGILEKRSNQLEKVLLVVNEIQTEIQNDKEQYEQILEDNDEHVNTPSSVRSEFISPVENNSPNLSPQQLLNDINDISSSNLIQNDVNMLDAQPSNNNDNNNDDDTSILSSHTLGDKNNEKMDEDDVAATDEIGMDEDDVAAADEIESSEDDSNEIVEDVIDSNFTVKRKKETFSGDEEEEDVADYKSQLSLDDNSPLLASNRLNPAADSFVLNNPLPYSVQR
ncbi:14864_t:CDS:2, partial [Entrophospora sp. SA101]